MGRPPPFGQAEKGATMIQKRVGIDRDQDPHPILGMYLSNRSRLSSCDLELQRSSACSAPRGSADTRGSEELSSQQRLSKNYSILYISINKALWERKSKIVVLSIGKVRVINKGGDVSVSIANWFDLKWIVYENLRSVFSEWNLPWNTQYGWYK